MKLRLHLTAIACATALPLSAATYHVDGKSGDDARSGDAPATAWETLGHAAEVVLPGDTVIVHPGVYHEHVQLRRAGTAEQPIRFAADEIAKNRVVLTGADPVLRAGKQPWRIEDQKLNIVYVKTGHRPARVLADEVDLFPYESLEDLKTLTLKNGSPGPQHGYAYDPIAGRLFVRLHKRYGSIDPNQRTMKVAPAGGIGAASRHADDRTHYNFGVLTDGPAHVILEGFTFETPGLCGVFVKKGAVTVKQSWFIGCRAGVSGAADSPDDAKRTDNVTIERCDFSHYPSWQDVEELAAGSKADIAPEARPAGKSKGGKLPPFFWQIRSGGPNTYDLGIALKVGTGWKITHNYIHDCIDGLSNWSLSHARNLDVSYNTFERLLDNAVESGNHSAFIRVHHNYLKDVFEPFAWNPKSGTPWPGPMLIDHNVVTYSTTGQKLWTALDFSEDTTPGCFEIGCTDRNWELPHMKAVPRDTAAVPGAGFVAYNNTIFFPRGNVFRFVSLLQRQVSGFRFLNNIVVTRGFTPRGYSGLDLSALEFNGNLVCAAGDDGPGPGKKFAGPLGREVEDYTKLGVVDAARRNFGITAQSPAVNGGVATQGLPDFSVDIGAFARGVVSAHELTGPQLTTPPAAAKTP